MPPKRRKEYQDEEPETKRPKHGKDILLTVSLTGARKGDLLKGIHQDSENTLLKITKGVISIVPYFMKDVDPSDLVRAVSKSYGISHSVAEQRIRDFPNANDPNRDNAQPLGRSCRHKHTDPSCECENEAMFCVLQPGALQNHAEEAGFGGRNGRNCS